MQDAKCNTKEFATFEISSDMKTFRRFTYRLRSFPPKHQNNHNVVHQEIEFPRRWNLSLRSKVYATSLGTTGPLVLNIRPAYDVSQATDLILY
jgi:hypothetical protein